MLSIPGSLFYFTEMAANAVGKQTAEFKVIGGGMMNWCAISHKMLLKSLLFLEDIGNRFLSH